MRGRHAARVLAGGLSLCAAAAVLAHGGESHSQAPADDSVEGSVESARAAPALAPGWLPLRFDAPAPGSYVLPRLGAAADGTVLDTEGRAQTLHALQADSLSLLAFIYTRCGDVNGCPLATAVMRYVANGVRKDRALEGRVRLLSLSFDPAYDTPSHLARHAEQFVPRGVDWRFLTTSGEAQLAPILRAYGQAVVKSEDTAETGGSYSHILRVFLVDTAGEIRNIYSTSFLHSDTVLADLRTLVAEANSPAAPKAAAGALPGGALLQRARAPQLGLPDLDASEASTLSAERIALGEKLFFDRRMSHNGTLSCAMCHVPEEAFTSNQLATAVGIEGAAVKRNAPTLLNVGHLDVLFHDGREYRLDQQVWQPLLARNEMANVSVGAVVGRIRSLPDYVGLFEAAFDGQAAGMQTVGSALAAYQLSLRAGNAPFDQWYFGGVESAVSQQARAGFGLFTGKAGCARCHSVGETSALFTDQRFHDTGIGYARSMARAPRTHRVQLAPGVFAEVDRDVVSAASAPRPNDLGRYEVSTAPADRWHYRTAPLRNVALTAPYMHDGSIATLAEVVEHYDAGGPKASRERAAHALRPLGLSAGERASLVAFLESLTSAGANALAAHRVP